MKKKALSGCIATIAIAGGLLLGGGAGAQAAETVDSFGVCVPSEASTTTVVHPAVGTPTIVVANPDYVAPTYVAGYWKDVPATYTPAVGTPTITVTKPNPAYVPAVAEIPEVSHTDYVAKRYVIDVHASDAVTHVEYQWKWWGIVGHGTTVWTAGDYPASGANSYPGEWRKNGQSKTVVDQDAVAEQGHWEEQTFHENPGGGWTILSQSKHVTQAYVPGADAQGSETIEVVEANPNYVPAQYTPKTKVWVPPVYTPAVGTKTITVDNPDFVPERTEIIEVAAVECPVVEPKPVEPAAETKPAVTAATKTEAKSSESSDTLAETGLDTGWALTGGAVGVAGLALGGLLLARRRSTASMTDSE